MQGGWGEVMRGNMALNRCARRDYQGRCTTRYNGSARISVWKRRALVLLVPQGGESNHTSNLFFHQSLIPQLGDCQTGPGGIDRLLRQDDKLITILFIAEHECDEQAVTDVLFTHNAILGTSAGHRNGPSVAFCGHVCSISELSFFMPGNEH